MKRLIAYTISLITILSAFAQGQTDTATVYFQKGSSNFDPAMSRNRQAMDGFVKLVREHLNTVDSIVVRGYASPEGNSSFNNRLSVDRCESVASYIVNQTGISPALISEVPEGEAWDVLLSLVEQTPEVPYSEEVIKILRYTPIWVFDSDNKVIDGRKRQLMRLKKGYPYRWMSENLFPRLRMAVTVSLYYKGTQDLPSEEADTTGEVPISDTHRPITGEVGEGNFNDANGEETATGSDARGETSWSEVSDLGKHDPFDRVAIKTNLLYYAILLPNLEVEGMINKNWSIVLEGDVAWYSNKTKDRTYQLAMVSPEVKYWIKPRAPWHGMFAGAFLGGAIYDFENGGTGYQGKGAYAGASFGYAWSVARHFSLEASIGVGYLYSRYKEYIPDDGHFVYMRTKALNYFGPLKLKFSLVWHFADSNKSK